MSKKFSLIGAIVAGAFFAGIAQSALADEAVDAGEKLYKRERCETCHGPTAEGSAAFPNLLTSPKLQNKEEFTKIVMEGKGAMPSFKANAKVSAGVDNLFAYLNDLAAKKKK